ncbi:hypothetical protein [Pseudalkalibacillus caeni]|uniref:Uncharacterized protein n=1 Tax=Exobacillus caeni TaxID=2574798 RepID=A0A5R9FA10_9BACL|nr:hypothetical protein [Pseudalkalibacillus caeni]TLS37693.1 hypothetical protein FCL54_07665 [Pseudalkalibacillus caeni]
MKRVLITFLLQAITWYGFSLVLHLSTRDKMTFKIIMFLIFLYLVTIISIYVMKHRKITFFITFFSTSSYIITELIVQ